MKFFGNVIDLHVIFIDYKSAYDSIVRNELYKALVNFGKQKKKKTIILLKLTMDKVECAVKIESYTTTTFDSKKGFQVERLFGLFALDMALRRANIVISGTIMNKLVQLLPYADETEFVVHTQG